MTEPRELQPILSDDGVYEAVGDGETFRLQCPFCGTTIRPPIGGHTWTCHPDAVGGGCGAEFEPRQTFEHVGDTGVRTDVLWRAFRAGFLDSDVGWNGSEYDESVERRLRARFEALRENGEFYDPEGDETDG